MADVQFRWRRAEEEAGEAPALFDADQLLDRHVGRGEFSGMEFLHVNARRIINQVPSASRVPFRWTINAYRGCSHACVYCFARPTHTYLDFDARRDFERDMQKLGGNVTSSIDQVRSWLTDRIRFATAARALSDLRLAVTDADRAKGEEMAKQAWTTGGRAQRQWVRSSRGGTNWSTRSGAAVSAPRSPSQPKSGKRKP